MYETDKSSCLGNRFRDAMLVCVALFPALSGVIYAHSANDGFNAYASDPNHASIWASTLQPDGKILIGGSFAEVSGHARSRVARLHTDGELDQDFVPVSINQAVRVLALQPDGKIMVVGRFTEVDGQPYNYIARLQSNGSRDESFVPASINDPVYDLALQPDGKVVIVGRFTEVGGQSRHQIARLNANGSLDQSFEPALVDDWINRVVLQADGRIVIVGYFNEIDGYPRLRAARLNPDGSLDQTFVPVLGSATRVYNAYSLMLQPNGKIILAYYASADDVGATNRIVRLHSDGRMDESFVPEIHSTLDSRTLRALALQPDGKIMVAGRFIHIGNDEHRQMVRLNPDGSIDDQFRSPTFDGAGAEPGIHDLVVQPDRKVVVVGSFRDVDGHNPNPSTLHHRPNGIVRLYPDGDQELNMLAAVDDSVGGHRRVNAIALQLDQHVLLGGDFAWFYDVGEGYGSGEDRLRTVRLKPSGLLDESFDAASLESLFSYAIQPDAGILLGRSSSISRWNFDGSPDPIGFRAWSTDGAVRAMVTQPDGKILVGGAFTEFTHMETFPRNRLVRLDQNGFLDHSFLFTGSNGPNGSVFSLALQPDGKIIVAGNFTAFNGNSSLKYIIRLNPDGSVDTGFSPPALNGGVYAAALQADGKIVIGGGFTEVAPFTVQRHIARLNPDGSVDSGFMTGVITNPGMNDVVRTLALQADGKIWAGGDFTSIRVGIDSNPTNRIVRLHPSGGLDKAFPDGADDQVNALALQHDGKILVGGHFAQLENEPRSRIARLSNPEPATQELTVNSSGTTLSWMQRGPAPQLHRVSFEQSEDGQTFVSLGEGTYNPAEDQWELSGQNLTNATDRWIRATGYYSTGMYNGSESSYESIRFLYSADEQDVIFVDRFEQ